MTSLQTSRTRMESGVMHHASVCLTGAGLEVVYCDICNRDILGPTDDHEAVANAVRQHKAETG